MPTNERERERKEKGGGEIREHLCQPPRFAPEIVRDGYGALYDTIPRPLTNQNRVCVTFPLEPSEQYCKKFSNHCFDHVAPSTLFSKRANIHIRVEEKKMTNLRSFKTITSETRDSPIFRFPYRIMKNLIYRPIHVDDFRKRFSKSRIRDANDI